MTSLTNVTLHTLLNKTIFSGKYLKNGKNTYGLIIHPGYTHERKAFVGQEITTLWQDIKNSLETFTLVIFQIFSYFCFRLVYYIILGQVTHGVFVN